MVEIDHRPHASAHLALLGDKQFLFNDARSAFIMDGISGRNRMAMGDPVGPAADFSLDAFDPAFMRGTVIGMVQQAGRIVAFVTLWPAGGRAEVEVDLMRYVGDAPPGIMRNALIEAMFWAKAQGYARFNLGMAPLSGIRVSAVTPVWNPIMLAVRGAGKRYYNFQGQRGFKEWFYPQWEPRYLVSPGGARRPVVVVSIASLVSSGLRGTFVK